MGNNYLLGYHEDLRIAWVTFLLSQRYFKDTPPYADLEVKEAPSDDLREQLDWAKQWLSNYDRAYLLVDAIKLRIHPEGIGKLLGELPDKLTLLVQPTHAWVAEELVDDVYWISGLPERLKILTKDRLMIEGTSFYSSFLSHLCYAEEAGPFDQFVSDHFLYTNDDLKKLLVELATSVTEMLRGADKESRYSKVLEDWEERWKQSQPMVRTFPVVADLFHDALREKAVKADRVRITVEKICQVFINSLTGEQIKASRLYESFGRYENDLRASGIGTGPSVL